MHRRRPASLRSHGEFEQHETRIAIIGRPNVGKSTLLNALTGTDRAIVSPIAGTTRDAVDEVVDHKGHDFASSTPPASAARARPTSWRRSSPSSWPASISKPPTSRSSSSTPPKASPPPTPPSAATRTSAAARVIIVVNKWDLVTTGRTDGKPPADRAIFERQLRTVLKYLSYAPVLFISATEGRNVPRVLDMVLRVAAERRKRVSTGQMNRFLDRIDFQRASVPMSKRIRIFYMTQAAVAPPTFILFTDRDIKLHFSFERFLENQIRAAFGFEGTPIWFKVRARNEASARK